MKHVELTFKIVLDAVEGELTGEAIAAELGTVIEELGEVWLSNDTACYEVRYASPQGYKTAVETRAGLTAEDRARLGR